MAAYFGHEELEDRMGVDNFGGATHPTAVQVDAMAVEISAMWDGLARQTQGTETPSETVKQACMSAAMYQVEAIRHGEPCDVLEQIKIMKTFMDTNISSTALSYGQDYPDSTGSW